MSSSQSVNPLMATSCSRRGKDLWLRIVPGKLLGRAFGSKKWRFNEQKWWYHGDILGIFHFLIVVCSYMVSYWDDTGILLGFHRDFTSKNSRIMGIFLLLQLRTYWIMGFNQQLHGKKKRPYLIYGIFHGNIMRIYHVNLYNEHIQWMYNIIYIY